MTEKASEQYQGAKPGPEDLDHRDKIASNFATAIAIIDCMTVLSALERSPRSRESRLANGAGFANGYEAMADSMPIALAHAAELIGETRALVELELGGAS